MNKYILKLIWIILLVGSLFFLKINLNRVFDWWSFCVGLSCNNFLGVRGYV